MFIPRLNGFQNRKLSVRKSIKYVKRCTSKRMRRLAKKLLEDTPKIITKGWFD